MVLRQELAIDDDGVVDSVNRPRSSGSQVTRCKYCNVVINPAGLDGHIEQKHPDLYMPVRREPAVQTVPASPLARPTPVRSRKSVPPVPKQTPARLSTALPSKQAPRHKAAN